MKKVAVCFLSFEDLTAKYLPYFLDSLKEQTYKEFKIFAIDNSKNKFNPNKDIIEKSDLNIDFEWFGGNLGFSKAYNKLFKKVEQLNFDYFFVVNPDVILEKNLIELLVQALNEDNELSSVCPKILRWDFQNKQKTKIIDSCGIVLKKGLRFIDLGQGEEDKGQFDDLDILGPSGAGAFYRISALKKVLLNNKQCFDELMFMYKEDCDLAYRLYLKSYKSKCIKDAIMYHDRTAKAIGESNLKIAINRKNKNRQVKEWSFLNQHIIFIRYWKRQSFLNKLFILWYEFKIFVFVLFFERYLLKQYKKLWKIYSLNKSTHLLDFE